MAHSEGDAVAIIKPMTPERTLHSIYSNSSCIYREKEDGNELVNCENSAEDNVKNSTKRTLIS